MFTRIGLIALIASMTLVGACNRDPAPKPKVDVSPSTSAPGGPASQSGGITGNATGGTPGGAATSSTPQGPAPGAGTSQTDQGGLASRPTERPAERTTKP